MNWFKTKWSAMLKPGRRDPLPETAALPALEFSYFYETAGRPGQQDALLLRPDKGVFLVCDGVGGAPCGEVASRLATDSFNALLNMSGNVPFGPSSIRQGVQYVQQKFTEYTEAVPSASGMATTLAMIALDGQKATCAHIGDSRIYHFSTRRKECLWQSSDHSVVQELLEKGELKTPEEMATHPMRRHITRAIQERRHVEPDITVRPLENGDILFLCTDGVLEPFSTNDLIQLLCQEQKSPAAALATIKDRCLTESTDNCTCIIVQIFL